MAALLFLGVTYLPLDSKFSYWNSTEFGEFLSEVFREVSVVTSLPSDQEFPVSIRDSAVGFSLMEDYCTVFKDGVFVSFQVLSCVLFREPCPLLSAGYDGPPIVSMFLNVVHRNLNTLGHRDNN